MVDEVEEKQISALVTNFLLNPDIGDEFSLEEFRDLFPSKYRDHADVKVLHKSFISKRRTIKRQVRKNIEDFYKEDEQPCQKVDKNQVLRNVITALKERKRHVDKELLKAKSDLQVFLDDVERCDKAVQNCDLMKPDIDKYFDMELLQKLESCIRQSEDHGSRN